jgi:dTDP-4-amino-4,6-dideoxygalactose transaminase
VIPFVDLKTQYASIKDEVQAAINGILESCQFTLGSEVAAFEQEFATYSQAKFGIAVNTGTSALHLALLAAGVGPGDEVITVPFTFVATVAAIHYTGAKPVLVDIDPKSFTMDPAALKAAITPRTKAVVPVHLYGQPADMDPILEVARRHNLVVIEDACQAHGAEYKGRRAGSIGDMGCFSFYPGKNLGAYGEGGMVTTSNPEYTRTIRMLRDWGAEKKYQHVLKGYN